jgi:hypothetical protein
MTLRHRLGALIYDWPRFLRHIGGDWTLIRNRDETITSDGRGVRCEWLYSSDLHIASVYPSAGRMLMRRAFRDWPVGGGQAIPPVRDRQDCLSSTINGLRRRRRGRRRGNARGQDYGSRKYRDRESHLDRRGC